MTDVCPDCVGDYVYEHAADCDRLRPVDMCRCRATETHVHDVWCPRTGIYERWRSESGDDYHYPRRTR